ncbi:MAG: cupin domain-containing protein [Syntrophobacterales bacterium]|nr:cupin domain-containing protein [Syntrophobacterales bacterium]
MVEESRDTKKGTGTDRPAKSMMPASEVFDIAGMVNYAEGSIVSRTLVESKGGTVTLFAFDAGQGLSEHTAPFDALVLVFDGEGEFTVGGKAHRVAAGQALLMPADIPHAVKAEGPFKMLLTMLRFK